MSSGKKGAALGIEPRTSRTRNKNHATRPSSHMSHAIGCSYLAWHTCTGRAERAHHHRARARCVARTQQHIAMPGLGFMFVPVGLF